MGGTVNKLIVSAATHVSITNCREEGKRSLQHVLAIVKPQEVGGYTLSSG